MTLDQAIELLTKARAEVGGDAELLLDADDGSGVVLLPSVFAGTADEGNRPVVSLVMALSEGVTDLSYVDISNPRLISL